MKTKRKEQLTALIMREISLLLPKHIRSETYKLLFITHVDLNQDCSIARVWVSASDNIDLLQNELNFKVRDIQLEMNKLLSIKIVPKLLLKADIKSKDAERIENILNKL